jgi:cobalt/nickel transport system permease protein
MSHLLLPDGGLPVALGVGGLLAALLLLLWSAAALRGASPQRVAYQAALGALMLVAMSVPLGPLAFHLSLLGVVGVLLGPAASFQVVLVVCATLALFGHGGLTVVGLNALVLGSGAAVARPVYRLLPARLGAGRRGAAATAVGQAVSGVLLLAVVATGSRVSDTRGHGLGGAALFGGLALPFWSVGLALEAGVAFGLMHFLERVQPALLPEGVEGKP